MHFLFLILGVLVHDDVMVNGLDEHVMRIGKFDDTTVMAQGYRLFQGSTNQREMFLAASSDSFQTSDRWDQNTGQSGTRYCGDNTDVRVDALGNLYVLSRRCFVPYGGFSHSFAVYRSEDKGLSWQIFLEKGVESCGMNGIQFYLSPDAQTIFLISDTGNGGGYLTLHYSTDAGETWRVEGSILEEAPFYPTIITDWDYQRLVLVVMGNQNGAFFRVRTFDLLTEDWTNVSVRTLTSARNVGGHKMGWVNDEGSFDLFVNSFPTNDLNRYRYDVEANTVTHIETIEHQGLPGKPGRAFRDRLGVTHLYATFGDDLYRRLNDGSWSLVRAAEVGEEDVRLLDVLTTEAHPNAWFDREGGLVYRVFDTNEGAYHYYFSTTLEKDIVLLGMVPNWIDIGLAAMIHRVNSP